MKDSMLQDLKRKSIEIRKGTKVIWPLQGDRVGALDMSRVIGEFLARPVYAINNSTIAYIYNGQFFITPYTRDSEKTLKDLGFTEESFYVPCSNGDIPKHQADKWNRLRATAQKLYDSTFAQECAEYCRQHHIREISDRALNNCLQVPNEGMRIRVRGIESTYFPILQSGILNESEYKKLGRYAISKNLVVFVYRNGKTYFAKGWWIITELNLAGFQSTKDFYIPSSLEDTGILDPGLKIKFAMLPAYI